MRRALVVLAVASLYGCGGTTTPAMKVTGECAAGDQLTFAPLEPATVEAALGRGTVRYSGLVFPQKGNGVPDAGKCTYRRGDAELTVALDRKTPFFTSVEEAQKLKTNALVRPIVGTDGYVFEEPSVGGRSVWAVVVGARDRIVWAHVKAPPSSRDVTTAAITALEQAGQAFDAPMEARRP